ncbi:MAG: hypothetical protein AB1349_10625 [Elusimicrobiota bacterium]
MTEKDNELDEIKNIVCVHLPKHCDYCNVIKDCDKKIDKFLSWHKRESIKECERFIEEEVKEKLWDCYNHTYYDKNGGTTGEIDIIIKKLTKQLKQKLKRDSQVTMKIRNIDGI